LFASGAASSAPFDPAMCMIFVADLLHAAGWKNPAPAVAVLTALGCPASMTARCFL
jgi:hypothetical protein